MPCYNTNFIEGYMLTRVVVNSKGYDWIVESSGDIYAPSHSTEFKRFRFGKEQTYTTNFPERKLSQCAGRHGYLEVAASQGGKRIKHLVHRLIGMAFVSGYDPVLTINHIDGNKLNNSVNNLEWVSLAKNTQLQWETGLVDLRGENSPAHKLTTKQVVYIRKLLNQGIPAHTLAIIAGVSPGYVGMIQKGKRWAHSL